MNNAFSIVNRAAQILLFLIALGTLAGCATRQPFVLFDDKTEIKSGTIAVISADGSDATVRLAEALTRELKERSTFKVVSQAKVRLRLGNYPVTIKEGKPENPEKPVWFGKGEKAKADAMQAQLKARYLFVVWTKFSRAGTSDTYDVNMNGNLVEYPKSRVIGYSHLPGSSRSTKGDEVNQMMKDSAARMADELISAAKADRPAKAGPAAGENP